MIRRAVGFLTRFGGYLREAGVVTLAMLAILVALIWVFGPSVSVSGKQILASVNARLVATVGLFAMWLLFMASYKSINGKIENKDPEKLANKRKMAEAKKLGKLERNRTRQTIKETVTTLESSSYFGPEGKSRYSLPWYLVIGPGDSGKTLALLNSGQKFPINEQADRNLYKLRATSQPQVLFGNQAIYIDTPGGFLEGGPGNDGRWSDLLRNLYKARPARPINGVIVTLSLRDLMPEDQSVHEHLARVTRDRLTEVLKTLKTQVPVYLLLTKTDAVPGFFTFFSGLSRSEREQIFGFHNVKGPMEPGRVRAEVADLLKTLNSQVFPKMHNERDLASRGDILNFPREMEKLSAKLEDFISEAFGPSRYHRPVMFRGFFFTCSVSAQNDLNAADGQGEWSFQTGYRPALGEYAKGYFISRVFTEAIIPEAGLAMDDRKKFAGLRFSQRAAKIAIFAAMVAAGFLLAVSFNNNFAKLHELELFGSDISAKIGENAIPEGAKYVLPELRAFESALDVFNPARDSRLRYGLGLYKGDKARNVVGKAYKTDLNGRFLTLIRADAAQQVENSLGDIGELKKNLRAYLMLCQPERLDPAFLEGWEVDRWSRQYQGESEAQGELRRQLTALIAYGIEPSEPDYALLERARQAMFQLPLAELAYEQVKEEAVSSGRAPFTFQGALGESLSPFEGDTFPIPFLYTRAGFETYLLKRCPEVIRELTSDSWVFGVSDQDSGLSLSELDVSRIRGEVGTLYYRDYIEYWSQALKALSVPLPENLHEVAQKADKLTSGPSPAVLVLRELRYNTNLVAPAHGAPKAPDTALAASDPDAAPGTDGGPSPEPPPGPPENPPSAGSPDPQGEPDGEARPQGDALAVKGYFSQFDALLTQEGLAGPTLAAANEAMGAAADFFERLTTSDDQRQASFAALIRISGEQDDTLRRLNAAAGKLPQEIGSWYSVILDGGLGQMCSLASANIDGIYRAEVLEVFNATLRDYYPFNPRSGTDANLNDFAGFFAAGGVVDSFQADYLKPFLNPSGEPKTIMGRSLPLNAKSVAQLNRASLVREAFFAGGSNPSLNYSIEPSTMDAGLRLTTLSHDGKTVSYWHGPIQGVNFSWPGGGPANVVFEDLEGVTQRREARGVFSIFRLFQGGSFVRREPGTGGGALIELRQNGKWTRFNVSYRNRANPFDPGISGYAPPPSLR
ncbi:MAG: type VI secretion system membrane subunit TssM [Deltaproteobacteria bacterium]|jgi:type VI secretion system protein ImpL|nr:type VI secretion system membrane subunit TssM [Deltaproteobacteria bacterium]